MVAGAAEPTAKRAKKDKEDPLVRRREELIVEVANARVAMKAQGNKAVREATESLLKALRSVCADLEAANHKLLGKLPPELWSKILDENIQQNDLLALAMTCRFFRDTTKDLGMKLEMDLNFDSLFELRRSGKMTPHSFGWFRWVFDTLKILPGYKWGSKRVKGAVYEADLVHYAAFEGSVEILRWLMEKKGWEYVMGLSWWAGLGGSIEVLAYLSGRGYRLDSKACEGAVRGGHLNALKFLRGLDPPCPWSEGTCQEAALGGQLEILKWARSEDPPCPWNEETCADAAFGGHLDVLKWLRAQNPPCPWGKQTCRWAAEGGHLEVLQWLRAQDPPCPWRRPKCRKKAWEGDHEHVVDWIDQQEDEGSYILYTSYGEDWLYSDDTIDDY